MGPEEVRNLDSQTVRLTPINGETPTGIENRHEVRVIDWDEKVPRPVDARTGRKKTWKSLRSSPVETVRLKQEVITPHYNEASRIFLDYDFQERKGEGAFGKVMTVRHKRTGHLRACKSIALKNKGQQKLVNTEIELMKQLDHPNVLRLYECYYEADSNIYLIVELCNGGSLFDRILWHQKKCPKPMSERQTASYLQQILGALAYCHSLKIIHRDIKPDNLLFINRKSDSPIKVIDFGLSDFMDKITSTAQTIKVKVPRTD